MKVARTALSSIPARGIKNLFFLSKTGDHSKIFFFEEASDHLKGINNKRGSKTRDIFEDD